MEKVKLGEIFEYLPKSKFKAGDGKKSGKYKFFTSSNVQDKYIDDFLYDGECLIFGTGGKASINYCNEKFSTSTDNFVVKVSEEFNTKLVYLYFKNDMSKLEKGFRGASIKHISKEYINQLCMIKYDLKSQQDIVERLDKLQEIIDLRKKQIEELEELVKAEFAEMFGDIEENKKLKELSILITKGSSPSWQGIKYVKDNTQILFITSENVLNGYLNLEKKKYLENKFNDIQSRSVLQYGDVLINIVGASIGRACIFNIDEKANINQAVALVRINDEKINRNYLNVFLNSEKAIEMYNRDKSDVARANLSLQDIGNLSIPLPPLELQNLFATIVQQIDNHKSELQKSLQQMQDLQESLMNRFFE